jgi:Methyltransferase domain
VPADIDQQRSLVTPCADVLARGAVDTVVVDERRTTCQPERRHDGRKVIGTRLAVHARSQLFEEHDVDSEPSQAQDPTQAGPRFAATRRLVRQCARNDDRHARRSRSYRIALIMSRLTSTRRKVPSGIIGVVSSVRRLNWGCGLHPKPGWVNSDIKEGPGIDVSCDIRNGLPFESDWFDYVVSIHALPEIPYPDLGRALAELRRVVKPGGFVRLCLPDLDRAIAAYQRHDDAYFLVPDEVARSIGGKLIVQLTWYGYSRSLFTNDFIEELLDEAGFAEVIRCAYKQTASQYAEIVDFDNRENESLFVEAVK